MTHNCQTILQPCLTPVAHCVFPLRTPRGETYESADQERCVMVVEIIRANPGISQINVSRLLGVSGTTASKTLMQLMDLGKIELVDRHPKATSQRKFYKIKEVLQ